MSSVAVRAGDRLFRQWATVSKLVVDGQRDPHEVSCLLQKIIGSTRLEKPCELRPWEEQLDLLLEWPLFQRFNAEPVRPQAEALLTRGPKRSLAVIPNPNRLSSHYRLALYHALILLMSRQPFVTSITSGFDLQSVLGPTFSIANEHIQHIATFDEFDFMVVSVTCLTVPDRDFTRAISETNRMQSRFVLTPFEVAILLLTHPEWSRLCGGPEFIVCSGVLHELNDDQDPTRGQTDRFPTFRISGPLLTSRSTFTPTEEPVFFSGSLT
ncbi:MAG: hypothetical protein PHI73_02740 [Patescibacteria group bacterium]|nr:hypothetical protein [Patescibacteria group bacterium]